MNSKKAFAQKLAVTMVDSLISEIKRLAIEKDMTEKNMAAMVVDAQLKQTKPKLIEMLPDDYKNLADIITMPLGWQASLLMRIYFVDELAKLAESEEYRKRLLNRKVGVK